MFKWNFLLVTLLIAIGVLYFGPAHARNDHLNSVGNTCGTGYDRDLCRIDPPGGGPLTADGQACRDSGYGPT